MTTELKTVSLPEYRKAYACILEGKCPQRNDIDGCPKWWVVTGETKTIPPQPVVIQGCCDSQEILGAYLEDALIASHATRETFSDMKEAVVNRVGVVLANNLPEMVDRAVAKQLTHAKGE